MDNLPKKRPNGRPSELTDEVIVKSRHYLSGGYKEVEDLIPSIAGLACYLWKTRSTIYDWAKINDEFSRIVEGILSLQEKNLLNGGLSGTFNATITKLVLSKHGYSEKVESDNRNENTITHINAPDA